MVSPVSISPTSPKTINTSIFYMNDEHSHVDNMQRLKTASDEFDAFVPSKKIDKLKLASGDFALGADPTLNKLAIATQNSIGLMATAAGNHEFDLNKKDLATVLKDNNYKILGINVQIPQDTPENKALHSEISNSYIQDVNGTKYGIIGVMPYDFHYHVTNDEEYKDFKVLTIDQTIPLIQKEIDNLQSQGVNKIILLSHAGYDSDVQMAQKIEGIDVILGGHTHNLIKGVQEGKNLFYSKKTGAPTVITQAGKDGNYYGILNLQFDQNGVITSVQNNVNKVAETPRSLIGEFYTNKFLGKPKVVGKVNTVEKQGDSLTTENPNANLINDAVKAELGVDVVIMNSGNMRSKFEPGNLTDRDILAMSPFKSKMGVVDLPEKELVDAIKVGAKSLATPEHMPGILQVSGLKYTMTKQGDVRSISFVDKSGNETPINVNSPNPFRTYKVAADSFVYSGGNGYLKDKTKQLSASYDFDKNQCLIDYLNKNTKPIDVKTDGRIQIVE